jgi:hypothetical protein
MPVAPRTSMCKTYLPLVLCSSSISDADPAPSIAAHAQRLHGMAMK